MIDYQHKVQSGTKACKRKVTDREGCLVPCSNGITAHFRINSLPLSSLPKINPSQLKDGGEWRKKKRQGTRATAGPFYLMERGEQTEGLASMRWKQLLVSHLRSPPLLSLSLHPPTHPHGGLPSQPETCSICCSRSAVASCAPPCTYSSFPASKPARRAFQCTWR